jgi:dimethylargininase
MLIAITRKISPAVGRCELTHLERKAIDFERASEQHRMYEECLEALGCSVTTLAAEPDLPDSVFVEDAAIVVNEVAVITRPGAASRRAETTSISKALEPHRRVAYIEAPATIDGGDVLRVGRKLYVGMSQRTNAEAVDQLRRILAPYEYAVEPVAVRGCLHLKSAVTQASAGILLMNPNWISRAVFDGMDTIEVAPEEDYGANCLLVRNAVIYPTCFPRTRERLEQRGIQVASVDVSELQKAEGAVTCCSVILENSSS